MKYILLVVTPPERKEASIGWSSFLDNRMSDSESTTLLQRPSDNVWLFQQDSNQELFAKIVCDAHNFGFAHLVRFLAD